MIELLFAAALTGAVSSEVDACLPRLNIMADEFERRLYVIENDTTYFGQPTKKEDILGNRVDHVQRFQIQNYRSASYMDDVERQADECMRLLDARDAQGEEKE